MFRAIIVLLFAGGAVAVFFVKTEPLYTKVKILKEQAVSFDDALSRSREIRETEDALLIKYKQISDENKDRLNKIVPSQKDAIKFIIELDDIIKNSGMVLRSVDVKDAAGQMAAGKKKNNPKLFETVSFTMKLAGSYESFYSFMKNMESNLRLVDINSVKFSSAVKNLYEFDVEASAYWKPAEDLQKNEK